MPNTSKSYTDEKYFSKVRRQAIEFRRNGGIVKCHKCSKVLPRTVNIVDHVRDHISKTPYQCSTCKVSVTRLLDHFKEKHPDEKIPMPLQMSPEVSNQILGALPHCFPDFLGVVSAAGPLPKLPVKPSKQRTSADSPTVHGTSCLPLEVPPKERNPAQRVEGAQPGPSGIAPSRNPFLNEDKETPPPKRDEKAIKTKESVKPSEKITDAPGSSRTKTKSDAGPSKFPPKQWKPKPMNPLPAEKLSKPRKIPKTESVPAASSENEPGPFNKGPKPRPRDPDTAKFNRKRKSEDMKNEASNDAPPPKGQNQDQLPKSTENNPHESLKHLQERASKDPPKPLLVCENTQKTSTGNSVPDFVKSSNPPKPKRAKKSLAQHPVVSNVSPKQNDASNESGQASQKETFQRNVSKLNNEIASVSSQPSESSTQKGRKSTETRESPASFQTISQGQTDPKLSGSRNESASPASLTEAQGSKVNRPENKEDAHSGFKPEIVNGLNQKPKSKSETQCEQPTKPKESQKKVKKRDLSPKNESQSENSLPSEVSPKENTGTKNTATDEKEEAHLDKQRSQTSRNESRNSNGTPVSHSSTDQLKKKHPKPKMVLPEGAKLSPSLRYKLMSAFVGFEVNRMVKEREIVSCGKAQCAFTFIGTSVSQSVQRHLLTHIHPKPFICIRCAEAGIENPEGFGNLDCHWKSKHPELKSHKEERGMIRADLVPEATDNLFECFSELHWVREVTDELLVEGPLRYKKVQLLNTTNSSSGSHNIPDQPSRPSLLLAESLSNSSCESGNVEKMRKAEDKMETSSPVAPAEKLSETTKEDRSLINPDENSSYDQKWEDIFDAVISKTERVTEPAESEVIPPAINALTESSSPDSNLSKTQPTECSEAPNDSKDLLSSMEVNNDGKDDGESSQKDEKPAKRLPVADKSSKKSQNSKEEKSNPSPPTNLEKPIKPPKTANSPNRCGIQPNLPNASDPTKEDQSAAEPDDSSSMDTKAPKCSQSPISAVLTSQSSSSEMREERPESPAQDKDKNGSDLFSGDEDEEYSSFDQEFESPDEKDEVQQFRNPKRKRENETDSEEEAAEVAAEILRCKDSHDLKPQLPVSKPSTSKINRGSDSRPLGVASRFQGNYRVNSLIADIRKQPLPVNRRINFDEVERHSSEEEESSSGETSDGYETDQSSNNGEVESGEESEPQDLIDGDEKDGEEDPDVTPPCEVSNNFSEVAASEDGRGSGNEFEDVSDEGSASEGAGDSDQNEPDSDDDQSERSFQNGSFDGDDSISRSGSSASENSNDDQPGTSGESSDDGQSEDGEEEEVRENSEHENLEAETEHSSDRTDHSDDEEESLPEDARSSSDEEEYSGDEEGGEGSRNQSEDEESQSDEQNESADESLQENAQDGSHSSGQDDDDSNSNDEEDSNDEYSGDDSEVDG